MKTVTYWFKKPSMDAARSALITSSIELLGGTIESAAERDNWKARFEVTGAVDLEDHKRLVTEELRRSIGVRPIITRTGVERVSASPLSSARQRSSHA